MSPMVVMAPRLSIACSTSGGSETFSILNEVTSMPYFAVVPGLIAAAARCQSRCSAQRRRARAILALAMASVKTDDLRAHHIRELVEAEVIVGAGHFFQEQRRVDDLEVVLAERRMHDAEVGVAHHDRVGRAPICCRRRCGW